MHREMSVPMVSGGAPAADMGLAIVGLWIVAPLPCKSTNLWGCCLRSCACTGKE